MKVPQPRGGDVRPDSLPGVHVGNRASAEHFGAAGWRDLYHAGGAVRDFGMSVLDEAERRQRECDDMMVAGAVNDMHSLMDEEERKILRECQGVDSAKIPGEMEKAFQRVQSRCGGRLATPAQRERFEHARAAYAPQVRNGAFKEADKQMAAAAAAMRTAQNTQVVREAARVVGETGGFADVRAQHDVVMLNVREKYRTLPEELQQVELDRASRGFHEDMLSSADAMRGPRAALEYLRDDAVRSVYTPAELKALEDRYADAAAFGEDRELGDRLGEEYDDEEALYDAVDEAMPDADDARRERVRKHAASRMRSRRSARAGERRELEDAAVQAMRAAGWSADAIDTNWPEDLRDKMLDKSEKELTKANNEIQRREKAERKAIGLEYLKLSPDELDRKILAGEWTGMLDDIGADSPEGKKLRTLANRDNPASQAAVGGRGGRTMLQYASGEYERLVGNPRSAKRRPDFVKFIQRVEEERDALAEELGVDPQMIPNGKQKEIIDKHLMNGDWRWFDDFPLEGNR